MTELSKEYLKEIIDSANEVITALADENPDLCKENTDGMIRAWDYLNDDVATPEVVRNMAHQLLAGMEQEPLYQVRYGEHWRDLDKVQYDDHVKLGAESLRILYAAPSAPVAMKDHQIRDLVNELRDIAIEYHGTQQLRERIAHTVRAAMLQGKAEIQKQGLTVWYGSMPESNGKTNWTAILHRKDQRQWEGITVDRSEYPDRVRYEADRMRHLIGELADAPDILTYDADAHSGYVEQPADAEGLERRVNDLSSVVQQRNGECDRLVIEQQNLVMLIKVLCRSLKKYNHSSELVKRATSYLTRGGFISAADCLRGELPGNSEQLDNAPAQFEALGKLVAIPGDTA